MKTQFATKTKTSEPIRVPMLIAGQWVHADTEDEIRDPYRGDIVAYAPRSTLSHLDAALDAATKAKAKAAGMPAYQRAELLRRAAGILKERAEDVAFTISRPLDECHKHNVWGE